jgi:hypothetical protein
MTQLVVEDSQHKKDLRGMSKIPNSFSAFLALQPGVNGTITIFSDLFPIYGKFSSILFKPLL